MIPNWEIGPVARRRLAEMSKAGWDDHTIIQDRGTVCVTVHDSLGWLDTIRGEGKTVHEAVEEAWRKWKAEERTA